MATKAIFTKTETNNILGFLNGCIEYKILTRNKAQAIYSCIRDQTVEAMEIEVYGSGAVYVKTYRTSKFTGETIAHQGFLQKQSRKLTLTMVE